SDNVLSYKLRDLDLNLSGNPTGSGLLLQAHGQDDFLQLNADITNLILAILAKLGEKDETGADKVPEDEQEKAGTITSGIGNFLADQILYNKSINSHGFTLDKQIADLIGSTSLGFQQTLSFTPTPTIVLLLSTGQVVFLHGTDPAYVTMP